MSFSPFSYPDILLIVCCRAGIAAANTSQVQYFDGEKRRDDYDEFYEQVVRVKNIGCFPFCETAQQLLVSYLRDVLDQPRAATWYEDTWTGENGHYSMAHAGYTGSNNNMGIEVDWRDMKHECAPSATLGTFTGSLVGLIEQLGREHRTFLAKTVANLFPARQVFTKRTWDKIQSVDDRTLLLSVVTSTIPSKQNALQCEWDAVAERIMRSGEPGAPLHLRLKAFHVDIARNEARRPGLKLEDITSMVVPRQSYLRRIDPDGKRPIEEVKKEVRGKALRYYNLIITERTKDRYLAEIDRGLLSAMDVYESFHQVCRQAEWAKLAERVELPVDEGAEVTSPRKEPPPPPPPQIPMACTCKWNYKWTVCEHTGLVASGSSGEYKVPDLLIAATPAQRKKTSSIRGTAGVRRKHLLKELAKAKTKAKTRLTYMDRPAPRPEPQVAAPAEELPPRPEPVIPQDVTYPSDDEVLVVLLSPWPTLTEVLDRAGLGARLGPGPSARPSSALHPAVSRLRPSVKSGSFHSA